MAGALDDLVAAVVRGWAMVARTWIEAANAILVAMLDLPDVESGRPGFNVAAVVVPPQQAPTALRPEDFSNWDLDQLPGDALTVEPGQVKAGEATTVRLLVRPPEGTASGTYTGSLCNATGVRLLDGIGVYVVGDTPP
jgi:hypothetical protein